MLEGHGLSLQRSRTITDGVHDAVLAAIVSGQIGGGDELRDKDWAARFAVSRTPVREAFKRLEAHGLTDVAAARFTRVRTFTPQEARREATDWAMLHSALVRSVWRGASPDFIEQLEQIRDRAELASGDERDVANFAFFDRVREESGRFGLRLAATAAAYRYRLVNTNLPDHAPTDAALQAEVVRALRSTDSDQADAAFEHWLSVQLKRHVDE